MADFDKETQDKDLKEERQDPESDLDMDLEFLDEEPEPEKESNSGAPEEEAQQPADGSDAEVSDEELKQSEEELETVILDAEPQQPQEEPEAAIADGEQGTGLPDGVQDLEILDDEPDARRGAEEEENASVLDNLDFIAGDSAKDKSRTADGASTLDEYVTRKKTRRRNADEFEAKKEKSVGFVKSHIALIGIICLVVVVAVCAAGAGLKKRKAKMAEKNANKPISTQEYEKDEHQEINDLITSYFDAYAKGDVETIQQYATPMTDKEKSYISQYSQFVDHYENITCYTKTGADENSYIVSVALQIKFKDVETPAPGLDFFYVRTGENGSVYIDNVYSTFNLLYQENPLDANIQQLITDYQTGEDVVALQASVQTQYEAALEKDENLSKMINETIAQAITAWENGEAATQQQAQQAAAQQVQQEEKAAADAAAAQAAADAAAAQQASAKKMYTTDTVNIREKADTNSKSLASASKGSEVQQLATTENGWSQVKTGDIQGYIKSEYLSETKPKKTRTLNEGTKVYLTDSVNVRKSMSESAERVGLAYSGETVTVITNYDEGWTKVKWKDKTGYIRTDILAGM